MKSTYEDAYMEFLTKLNRKKEADAKRLLNSLNAGGSSSSGAKSDVNIAHHDQLSNTAGKGAPSQTTAEATAPAPTTPLDGNNMPISDEDVYGGLDNIFEIENSSWFWIKLLITWKITRYGLIQTMIAIFKRYGRCV